MITFAKLTTALLFLNTLLGSLAFSLVRLPAHKHTSKLFTRRKEEEDEPKKNVFDLASESLENVVKKTRLVGDDYKLGDIGRSALSKTFEMLDTDNDGELTPSDFTSAVEGTVKKVEGTVKKVTGDEDYRFGDLSKKAARTIGAGLENTVQTVTGDSEYKFGDYTNNLLKSGDAALNKMRDDAFNQLPKQVWEDVLDGLTAPQREAVAVSLIQVSVRFMWE